MNNFDRLSKIIKPMNKSLMLYNGLVMANKVEADTIEEVEIKPLPKPPSKRQLRKAYKLKVWEITRQQPLSSLPNFDKRGWHSWHLDHIISIFDGYKKGISPEVIGRIDNLRMIPYKENYSKGINSDYEYYNSRRVQGFLFPEKVP